MARDPGMVEGSVHKARSVKRILLGILVLNLGVAVAKLAVGAVINSVSMVADGFHSLTDSASNVVGLIGISLAARPPDEDHPYGHSKYETLAALVIGGLLAATAWGVLKSCWHRLQGETTPEVTTMAFAVMAATILVNLGVTVYERRRGLSLGSDLLTADAAHTRSDIYVSLAVIASLAAAHWGYPQLDLLAAVVITVVIAWTAAQILRRSADQLIDAAVVPPAEVRQVALTVPGIEGVHKVRTRSGPGGGTADLHVQVQPDMPLDQAHDLGHQVADRIREELGLAEVLTHVEPASGRRQPGPQD